jgi:hypothetical protein
MLKSNSGSEWDRDRECPANSLHGERIANIAKGVPENERLLKVNANMSAIPLAMTAAFSQPCLPE